MTTARAVDTLFRHAAKGREALAPPGEGGTHVHYEPRRSVGIGCITSRRQPALSFFERLALELGVNVTEAKQLWKDGKIK